jgi:phage terminase large subunit-like protein
MARFGPQPGAQTQFAECNADIAFFVGQPGSGKSVGLTLELLRWVDRPGYVGAGFRKNSKQLFGGGSLWALLNTHAKPLGGTPVRSPVPTFTFRTGASIELHHAQLGMQTATTHDGKAYDVAVFDELPHFAGDFFWYIALTRNRSSDARTDFDPYVRASAMATPDTFVHELVKPWIFKDGWPDYEQSGKVRWFVRNPNTDLIEFFPSRGDADDFVKACTDADDRLKLQPKSLAIVHAVTEENLVLMRGNPNYQASLGNLTRVERLRMQGNWEARPASAGMFDRQWYGVRDEMPRDDEILFSVRGWDKASTKPSEENPDPDFTRGVRLDLLRNGQVLVSDVASLRDRPGPVNDLIARIAVTDGPKVTQAFWHDPAQAGAQDEYHMRQRLSLVSCGPVVFTPATKSKEIYAAPASAYADRTPAEGKQMTAGFSVLRRGWNAEYFKELEEFPRDKNAQGERNHKDQVDAQSAAWIPLEPKLPTRTVGGTNFEALLNRIDVSKVRT